MDTTYCLSTVKRRIVDSPNINECLPLFAKAPSNRYWSGALALLTLPPVRPLKVAHARTATSTLLQWRADLSDRLDIGWCALLRVVFSKSDVIISPTEMSLSGPHKLNPDLLLSHVVRDHFHRVTKHWCMPVAMSRSRSRSRSLTTTTLLLLLLSCRL